MKRILSIDYGTVRIGLAWSDTLQMVALPLTAVRAQPTPDQTIDTIFQTAPLAELELIVIGLPLLLSGKDSSTTKQVRSFC